MKTKLLSILALLLVAVSGAVAQTETLLTTITATGKEQANYSTANVATVSFSYTAGGSSAYLAAWGWWGYGWTATVTPAEGYTITKCIFYDDADRTATDSEAPFVVETTEEDKTPRINGTPIDGGKYQSKGLKKIEVYGYVTPTATQYSVTLAEGTDDAGNWTISPATAEEGQTVTITYNGTKKVKSVKAVKKAAKVPAITPDIAQANCTFSPSNGKSTLSNANITTSMEYSTDGGTTWTDVTTVGSIASLEAGTVQIRVKENDDNLASEAVSITVPQVLKINELVGPYYGQKLTCEYYAGETWQALVDRYDLIKVYSGRAAFDRDGFIYDESGSAVSVTALVDNTKTYEVQ